MKEGAIFLYEGKGLVAKAIQYFTQNKFTHVAGYVRGSMYESTVWFQGGWWRSGIHVVAPFYSYAQSGAKVVLEPKVDLTESQASAIQAYFIEQLNERRPYNVFKLLVLAFVYPTRWFWKKIGWVPFQSDWWGEVCSVVWGEGYKRAKLTISKTATEALAPRDWDQSTMFNHIEL